MYHVDDVYFSYGKNEVLRGVNLSVHQGDFLVFIGANGSGKSTFIKLLLGIERPDRGQILYRGEELSARTDFSKVSYVPQLAVSKYDFPITIRELVGLGLYGEKIAKEERAVRISDVLSLLNISHLEDRLYGALSGGQRQRVLIAKALISLPDVLILDEPTTGIDFKSRNALFRLLKHLHDVHHMTILMITHEMYLIEDLADEVYTLEDGVLERGVHDGGHLSI
ncbi:MAG: metal ABC transporter ATP-binding protein [Peptoniphilus sp.]|nr:metal ABC transporter ATP-binding protein [Peptoniphilus sp.]